MRRLAHFALPLAVFAVGLAVGAWFFGGHRAAGFAADGGRSLGENAAATLAPVAETARAFPSDEEMLTALMSAVADDEPLRRAHRLHDILGRLHSAELAVLFDRAVRVDDRDRRGVVLNALIRRWGAIDPAAAAAAVRPYRERFRAVGLGSGRGVEREVNEAWAQAQPDAALEWAVAHGVDVGEAKSMLYVGDDGTRYYPLLSTAFQSDRAKTLAWARAQPRSPERDTLLSEGIWGGTTEQNIEVFNELTPAGQAAAAARMMPSSFQNDTGRMEPWVKALPAGAARRAAIQSLANNQADKAPESLDTLADAWPAGADRDAALKGMVWSVMHNEPRRALDFARRMGDPATREYLLESAAGSWFRQDEAAARAWIVSTPELSAEQKRVLIRQHDGP